MPIILHDEFFMDNVSNAADTPLLRCLFIVLKKQGIKKNIAMVDLSSISFLNALFIGVSTFPSY